MKKQPYGLLPLALAISLAACQPGSTPVQHTPPSPIPAPRHAENSADPFRIQSGLYLDGYCGQPKDEWGFTQMPGSATGCYNEGGAPIWNQLPVGNGLYCLAFAGCSLPGSGDGSGGDAGNDGDESCSSSEGRLCRIASGGQQGNVSLELSSPYMSPNGDGVKDSVSISIEDPDEEGWILEIKRDGVLLMTRQGKGSASSSWDGANQPEGRYNVVLKLKQAPNLRLPLILDVTPPIITHGQTTQPNGRSVFAVKIQDNLAGLVPEDTGVDLQGINASTLQERIGPKEASFRYQILPSDPVGVFQTQSLMPFSILQTLEDDYDTGQASINAADPAGNSAFQVAQVQVPKYNPAGQPGGNYEEKCKSRSTAPNGQPNQLRLAKVYDFDTGGPNLTFVIRFNTENPPRFDMINDPISVLNSQQLGVANKNLRIIGSAIGELTANQLEKMLYDPNYDNVNQPEGKNNFGDKGSFWLQSRGVTLATRKVYTPNGLVPQFPKLNQIVTELGPRAAKKSHAKEGYIITSVDMSSLYRATYATGTKAQLSLKHGQHVIDVQAHFNKTENRWIIGCAN